MGILSWMVGLALLYAGFVCLVFYDRGPVIRDRWFTLLRLNRIGNRWRVAVGLSLMALAVLVIAHGAILVLW